MPAKQALINHIDEERKPKSAKIEQAQTNAGEEEIDEKLLNKKKLLRTLT